MSRTTSRILTFLAIGLLTGGVACVDSENFRSDVIHCEDALSHAIACCPGLTPPETACVYEHESGSGDCGCTRSGQDYYEHTRTPAVGLTRSYAIASATCEDLALNDGCAALAAEFAVENLHGSQTDCNGQTTVY